MPKLTRRNFIKGLFGTIVTTFGMSLSLTYYAGKIEPRLLKTKKLDLTFPNLPPSFHGLKIIQLNDTHLGFQYTLDQFNQLISTINQLEPDLIFFVGDLLDEPNKYKEVDETIHLLQKLEAKYGKIAVYGNHDHGGYGTKIYRSMMEKGNFLLLQNEAVKIEQSKERIYILGIDDPMLGNPNIAKTIKGVPENAFKILLSHAPDLADQAVHYPIQLQLSGHSHGGQIKIPFFGALVKPPYGEKYVEGKYELNQLTLYVNRGIGTTRLPYRFLSTPEITLITLKSN